MATTPERFILKHARAPYDPVKAHEYYIRTRKLKGRKVGLAIATARNLGAHRVAPKLSTQTQKPVSLSVINQAAVKSRVDALEGKLKILQAILTKLVNEAKGSTPTKKATKTKSVATKTKSAASKDRKPLTTTQKRDRAKKAKIRYQKLHPQSEAAARKQKIAEVKAKIEEVRAQLKEALDLGRKLATEKQPA